ncbi:TlpA family protein disulfide reductase [Salibacterium salarium]|uniref:TlpA family protein disulfide reductase n=1 Tax=Salibacterium salarium TaxID=284579 RepID=A0A428N589_9BACI|nr:TlpA disulfide reductase family protein [Salibacterium salarium]RSL33412.1 TlpA family protein disulfide reductase [Salibacterium salarium]
MQAPDFELQDMFHQQNVHLEDFKGKPLMLTFWASWCPDSKKDLAQKQTFYDNLDSSQLQFLTVNVTGREGKEEDPISFMENNNYTFPVLCDKRTKTYDRYQCMGVPTTFILDENLNVVHRYNDKAAFIDIMKGLKPLITK